MPKLLVEHAHPTRRVDEAALKKLVRHVLAEEGCRLRSLSVILTDHETVLHLNRTYLEHDYQTDVLAFPLDEDTRGTVEGEIYVDLDTAAERHAEFGATFEEEVRRYVIHGLLHLTGHDDTDAEARAAMRALEDRYLQAAG